MENQKAQQPQAEITINTKPRYDLYRDPKTNQQYRIDVRRLRADLKTAGIVQQAGRRIQRYGAGPSRTNPTWLLSGLPHDALFVDVCRSPRAQLDRAKRITDGHCLLALCRGRTHGTLTAEVTVERAAKIASLYQMGPEEVAAAEQAEVARTPSPEQIQTKRQRKADRKTRRAEYLKAAIRSDGKPKLVTRAATKKAAVVVQTTEDFWKANAGSAG